MNFEKNIITGSIVVFNNDYFILSKAINSFVNSSMCDTQNIKLFIVDNSPTNDIEIKLNKNLRNSNIEYIHNPSNPGFGAAHNIAIKKAFNEGSQYHLVLNPDVYFNCNVIKDLTEYMNQNTNVANIMPKVLYPNGELQYLCKLLPTPYDWIGRRFNPSKKMVEKRNKLFELRFSNYDKIMEVPYLSGCFMYLRISALKNTGLFDENIFMYGEETDLCRRFLKNGYKTIYYPFQSIYHNFEKGSHKSCKLTFIGIQSAIYYFNKWGWFFDKERKCINKITLEKLNYHE